ncbi:MAG: AMP-binding protein, partial [Saprospiraceae bacterium]|nr:AMP-binding protein [Saprospiraceae bacterium]
MSMDLSPAKQKLLENWLKGNRPNDNPLDIPKRKDVNSIQLSFPQQRQLFMELLDRNTAVNNLSVLLKLKGCLNIVALKKCANEIIKRHEVLRTQFVLDKGMPSATLIQTLELSIPVIEMTKFHKQDLSEKVLELAEMEVLIPFNLSQAPLIRLKLYKLKNDLFYFLIVIHHTVADGWSLGVFLKELMSLYRDFQSESRIKQTELPIQYYDYAKWQTDDQKMNYWERELDYWKNQLKGDLPVLELPTDKSRGPRQSYEGGTYNFIINKDETKALEQLSREEDVTLFMTLLSVFYIVLHRYCNQDEILIGTPVANRNLPELEDLIGAFINILVLRIELNSYSSFRSILAIVKRTTADAFTNKNLPFEKLVEELKPKRDLSRTPLFQVLFNLQNSPRPKLEITGIESSFVDINRGVSQFDLTLMITKTEGQCVATVEYNKDLFKEETIARLFQSYQLIIRNVLNNPDISISEIPLVTELEMRELVSDFCNLNSDIPLDKKMHQLFEEQVRISPDQIAVIFGDKKFTYSEINSRANVIGRHLHKHGLNPGDCVGVLMPRSNEIIESLIG